MKASVIIPAYNARAALRGCLLSLAHQNRETTGSFEVIVVDDGSSDGTGEMIERFPADLDLRYVHEPRTPRSGRARARNIGLAMATGDLVVTLDADQVVAPSFIGEHIRAHATDPDLLLVGRRMQLGEGDIEAATRGDGFDVSALPEVVRGDERERLFEEFSFDLADMVTAWHHVWTCNASVRRDRLNAVGGFDEGFTGWGLEDAEVGYRLARAGVRMRYTTRAAVHHVHREPLTTAMYREWRRNLAYFIHKHPDPIVRLQEMFAPAIDPEATANGGWVGTAARFEAAARALERERHRPPLGR
ncbi:glycosyltransferase family 2 protein [Streptomyces alkaliphilus]|uniref:glycosyltransferase family 2 protein n=1 Tax=Streptomyces alkaliphilus TaxID=1472722 RepID=UPI0015630BDB|nr:glycosyltransferase [Streptomyces alkaliphilus]